MALKLNPDMLRAAYNYLDETQPFIRWNLPDSDDIVFRIIRRDDRFAHYRFTGDGKHVIAVSAKAAEWTTLLLLETMAHEMIHLHAKNSCIGGADHGAAFKKHAAQVCRVHGFNLGTF